MSVRREDHTYHHNRIFSVIQESLYVDLWISIPHYIKCICAVSYKMPELIVPQWRSSGSMLCTYLGMGYTAQRLRLNAKEEDEAL